MIDFISGKLVQKFPNFVVINANGIGYKINISLNSYEKLNDDNEPLTILTYLSISENNHDLYGFIEKDERELFLLLISVSGIGPKTAINMLSSVSPNDFKSRLIAGEVKMLTSLPGIGTKTAKRIIIELKDKFVNTSKDELPIEANEENVDAFYALKNLGFQNQMIHEAINKVVNQKDDLTTENLIKEELKILR